MLDGIPRSAHCTRTLRPVAGEPVKTQASMPASTSAAPTSPVALHDLDEPVGELLGEALDEPCARLRRVLGRLQRRRRCR